MLPSSSSVQPMSPRSSNNANGSTTTNYRTYPSWFQPDSFVQTDYNPQAYIAGLRRYVPLEQVSQELEKHLAVLKNRLVEVINEDYNDFVSLSTKLVNIDGSVLRMQKPLLELKERLGTVQQSIRGQLDALNEGLVRRQQVAACRTTLELMQDTAHVMSKVEKLVAEAGEAGPAGSMSDEELDRHARLLERVGGEMARLHFFAARGQELPFMQQLAPRLSRASDTIGAQFDAVLETALTRGNQIAVFHCLHAYAAVNATAAGEAVIRRVVVLPVVRDRVAAAPQGPVKGPAAVPGPDVLPALLADVSSMLHKPCGKLLEATLSPQGGLQGFNLLGNCILAEVDAQLAEHLPGVFSPGVPDSFHSNYLAAASFLASLEGQCQTQASVNAFRECGAYQSFMRRWNLPVYFSLRFQEVAGTMEQALSSATSLELASTDDALAQQHGLRCAPSLVAYTALLRCCDGKVLLRPLADKFTKLGLQVLKRYVVWINSGLAARSQSAEAGAAHPAAAPQGSPAAAAGSSPAGDTGAQSAAGSWAPACSHELLTLLAADVSRLHQAVENDFLQRLLACLQGIPQEAQQGLEAAIAEAVAELRVVSGHVCNAVVLTLADRCIGALKQLRGIVATFRMSNKAEPTRPSHYVAAIFNPLKAFVEGEQAQALDEEQRAAVVRCVSMCRLQAALDGVTDRYRAVVDDTLTTARKTESSLKRLKGRKGTAEAGEVDGHSTDQMLTIQLFLDVQEYGRHLQRFKQEPQLMESYCKLWNCVAPAKLQNAVQL